MKRNWEDREKSEFLKVILGSECEDLHFLTRKQLVISVQDDSDKGGWFFQGYYSLRNAVILEQFMWDFKQEGRWWGRRGETSRRKHCHLPSHLFLIHKDGDTLWGETRVQCRTCILFGVMMLDFNPNAWVAHMARASLAGRSERPGVFCRTRTWGR